MKGLIGHGTQVYQQNKVSHQVLSSSTYKLVGKWLVLVYLGAFMTSAHTYIFSGFFFSTMGINFWRPDLGF